MLVSVDPLNYLIAPRICASIIMIPLLSGFFSLFGVISAFSIGVGIYDVDVGVFFDNIRAITNPSDIISGLEKAMIFGAIFSSIGCYKGFTAGRGAKGLERLQQKPLRGCFSNHHPHCRLLYKLHSNVIKKKLDLRSKF